MSYSHGDDTRPPGLTKLDIRARGLYPDEARYWPTPDAGNFNDGQSLEVWKERHERELEKGYNGNGGGTPLAMAVRMPDGKWPTPVAADARAAPRTPNAKRGPMPGLPMAVSQEWPTPMRADAERSSGTFARGNPTLTGAVASEPGHWPTPTAGDAKSSGSRNLEGSEAHPGVSLTDMVLHGNSSTPRATSPASGATAASPASGSSMSPVPNAGPSETGPSPTSAQASLSLPPDGSTTMGQRTLWATPQPKRMGGGPPGVANLNEHVLWMTPQASDAERGGSSVRSGSEKHREGPGSLPASVSRTWPTPTRQDGCNNGAPSQMVRNTKPLNAAVKEWPTPLARDSRGPGKGANAEGSEPLSQAVHGGIWPTPQARDEKGPTGMEGRLESGGRRSSLSDSAMPGEVAGRLNADWVELLMGFPPGWTDIGVQMPKKRSSSAGPRDPAKSSTRGSRRAPPLAGPSTDPPDSER